MGWKGVTIVDQRVRFIAEYLRNYFPFSELCSGTYRDIGTRDMGTSFNISIRSFLSKE